MKDFFKLMGHGILMIGLSIISLALLIFPVITIFMELPNMTGFKAVGEFILSIFQLACGCLLTCILGLFSIKGVDAD